jgi:hypothetical protein
MSDVQSTASPPVRLPKPPTKEELVLALYAVDTAYGMLRGFMRRGRLCPRKVEVFLGQVDELRKQFNGDPFDPETFYTRGEQLDHDQTYANELPRAEIA